MYNKAKNFVCLPILCLVFSSAYATDVLEYTQKKLPNGNTVMDYTSSDGTRIQQVQHSDGTITTVNTDSEGKQTITRQDPDGTVDVKKIDPQTASSSDPNNG